MTPEQQKLLDGILERAHGLAESTEERAAIVELTCAIIRQPNSLRWRKQSEDKAPAKELVITAPASNWFLKELSIPFEFCRGEDVEKSSLWLPLPEPPQ